MITVGEMKKLKEHIGIYEENRQVKLDFTEPVVVRIVQQEYRKFCENLNKPYDSIYSKIMTETMRLLCKELPGCTFGILTHDEINLIFTCDNKNNLSYLKTSKTTEYLVSTVSSRVTSIFNEVLLDEIKQQEYKNDRIRPEETQVNVQKYKDKMFKATFKVNAFNLPDHKLYDYIQLKHFICRRDSVVEAVMTYLSKDYVNQSTDDLIKLLKEKCNYNWENNSSVSCRFKNGIMCNKVKDNKETKCFIINIERPLNKGKDKVNIERMMHTNSISGCINPYYTI